ncbi:MAG: imidazole glycerol phosphate synthase subunit HisH [Chloroflexota bacterium]
MKAWPEAATIEERGLPVAVVDHGAGNLVSIRQALSAVGAEPRLATHPGDLEGVAAIVLPGVGAAAPAMERLAEAGLVPAIASWVADGRPLLGICLGLQLLFEGSDEDGAQTFGFVPGRSVLLRNAPRLPHIGWNQVERVRDHPVFAGTAPDADFYFVHSYAGQPAAEARWTVLAETEHGERFVSVLATSSVVGVQFHPERSGADGLRLLGNFVRWATAIDAGRGARTVPAGAGGGRGGD